MDSREVAITQAIADYNTGRFSSQRAAAIAYDVPRSTLSGRLKGAMNSSISHHHQQRLSPDQEESLADWILEEDTPGFPPSHARAREMANHILKMNNDQDLVGKAWILQFIQRNPRVASVIGKKIEASRAEAATVQQIRAFLELFKRTQARLNIQQEDIYNMDETGIALGVCTNTRVIASSSKKKTYVKSPENREWVSIIESISATGRKLRCVVIFKGASLQTTWFSSKTPDWLYTTSENGWTSKAIGLKWLQRVFLPSTTPLDDRYRLLILDGHGSHIDIDFLWECKQHKVELLYLPAHSSHILQPLDLAPFSVIKSNYRRQIQELSSLDDAAPVKKERFIHCYNQAREAGFSERVVRAGWRASGLSPFNISQVIQSSQITDRPITPPPQNRPPQPPLSSEIIYQTPQKPQDIYLAQQTIQKSEALSRTTRLVFQKAAKAIGKANARAAGLEATNSRLRHELERIQPQKKRKRIVVEPNQRFADVEKIMSTMHEAAAKQAEISANSEEAITTATTVVAADEAL